MAIIDEKVLYVSDPYNNRIVVVHLDATSKTLVIEPNKPYDICILDKSLYVLESDNYRIVKLTLNGTNLETILNFNQNLFSLYIDVDKDMNIYLSVRDRHKIVLFSAGLNVSRTVAGTGTQGSDNTQLNEPYGIFVDDDGTLYIADRRNHRIMKWSKNASSGIRVAGDGTAGSALTQLSAPTYVVLDINRYMYIIDSHNKRIIRWKLGSLFGVCIASCSETAPIQLLDSHVLAFDSNGSLYASEWAGNRVQKFQILDNLGKH